MVTPERVLADVPYQEIDERVAEGWALLLFMAAPDGHQALIRHDELIARLAGGFVLIAHQ